MNKSLRTWVTPENDFLSLKIRYSTNGSHCEIYVNYLPVNFAGQIKQTFLCQLELFTHLSIE